MFRIVLMKKDYKKKIIGKITVADSFIKRFKGLMLRKDLKDDDGIILTDTKQIHTFWMLFSIDVLYLMKIVQGTYIIIDLEKNLRPWRIGKYGSKVTDVLELSEGMIDKHQIEIGEIVRTQLAD